MRAVKVGLGSLVLALGLWMAAAAESAYTVRLRLQTDRPAYVVGQTVRVRFVIITETTLSYWLGYTPALKIVDAHNKLVRGTGVDDPFTSTNAGRRGEFHPGNTTLETYGWRRARVVRQWFDLTNLGYHVDQPGKYTIVADGSLEDYNVKASPPVTFQVLTMAMARMRPPDVLTDAGTNLVFRKLASDYVGLRSDLVRMIAHVRKGATWQDLVQNYAIWDQERGDLQNQIDSLSSSGSPSSPYVQVSANLENAVEALGAAGERTMACDAPSATLDLGVSDYFFDAVRTELATGRANVADAADPPPYGSPSGYCKGEHR